MRTKTISLYQYDELTDEAKEKAREWYCTIGIDMGWAWETVKEDASQIGLQIISLDDHRPNQGEFIGNARDTARLIIRNHGKICETYRTAEKYLPDLEKDNDTEEWEDSAHEFLHDLLEDYRVMLKKEYEYLLSTESIEENIRANEYEFTENGKRS